MTSRQLLVRDLLVLFGLAGWALALPYWGSEFIVSLALTCLMYVALSSSWALFCGTTRYLSLATSAFFGIGAYTSAILLEQLSWVQAIALGSLIAAAVAVVKAAAAAAAAATKHRAVHQMQKKGLRALFSCPRDLGFLRSTVALPALPRNAIFVHNGKAWLGKYHARIAVYRSLFASLMFQLNAFSGLHRLGHTSF